MFVNTVKLVLQWKVWYNNWAGFKTQLWKTHQFRHEADTGVGLRPLGCRDHGFESRSGMDVYLLCLYVVLSCAGRGLCDWLITRPEESYRVSKYMCDHRNPARSPAFHKGTTRKMMIMMMRHEVLAEVKMSIMVFCVLIPCRYRHQRFGETYCFRFQGPWKANLLFHYLIQGACVPFITTRTWRMKRPDAKNWAALWNYYLQEATRYKTHNHDGIIVL
jgi:hypothetical protein